MSVTKQVEMTVGKDEFGVHIDYRYSDGSNVDDTFNGLVAVPLDNIASALRDAEVGNPFDEELLKRLDEIGFLDEVQRSLVQAMLGNSTLELSFDYQVPKESSDTPVKAVLTNVKIKRT